MVKHLCVKFGDSCSGFWDIAPINRLTNRQTPVKTLPPRGFLPMSTDLHKAGNTALLLVVGCLHISLFLAAVAITPTRFSWSFAPPTNPATQSAKNSFYKSGITFYWVSKITVSVRVSVAVRVSLIWLLSGSTLVVLFVAIWWMN